MLLAHALLTNVLHELGKALSLRLRLQYADVKMSLINLIFNYFMKPSIPSRLKSLNILKKVTN